MIKVKIYVINLKRRSDRYESFCNKYPLDKSKLNKFEAFDGRNIKKIFIIHTHFYVTVKLIQILILDKCKKIEKK